jgi:hypothetical protein
MDLIILLILIFFSIMGLSQQQDTFRKRQFIKSMNKTYANLKDSCSDIVRTQYRRCLIDMLYETFYTVSRREELMLHEDLQREIRQARE